MFRSEPSPPSSPLGALRRASRIGQLAATRSIFNYAMANDLLALNPAAGVIIKQRKKAGTKMLGYSDAEVARILALAAAQTKPKQKSNQALKPRSKK